MIRAGDVIEIDNDNWAYAGKQFEVVEITTHIDTTACNLILRELNNPDRRHVCTLAYHQLNRVDIDTQTSTQYDLFPTVELKPSLIENAGVGVFALVEISADSKVFSPAKTLQKVKLNTLSGLSERQKWHLKKLAHVQDDQTVVIDRSANEFHAAYFINHSTKPNMIYCNSTYTWYAMRDIHVGEELTAYYFPHERDF